MMYWWFCYMWYCASMVASKISIGWFLLRITVRKSDIITIWLVLACTVATGMVFFFTTLFQCSPQSYFWNRDQDGKCINIDIIIALTYLYSAFSLVCDFTFALLPVVLIMKLNLKRSHKYALIPIVMMACVASTAVLVRFAYVKDFKNPDFLWATIDIAIWSTTEQGLAITAGSLATLRPLVRLVTSKVSSLYGNRSTNLRASDHPHPPTIGGMGSKHKLNRPHGPFSLITAGGDDDRDLPAGKDIEMPERMWSIEKKSAWTMTRSRVDGASSEEELTAPGKHWDDSHLRTKTVIEAVPREE
ncbi:hypothetical protein NLU13_8973 [Sarocladium strictum]|nr:hypothetical protein NLU13_8973 [Sarocladium strictum]